MYRLRRLAIAHRTLAALVIAVALAIKVMMPAGFMPVVADGRIVVAICSGTGPMTMTMAIPGARHGAADRGEHGAKPDAPCAFSSLSAPTLSAADPVLLAVAIRYALARGLRVVAPLAHPAPAYLRPPLRGPPLLA